MPPAMLMPRPPVCLTMVSISCKQNRHMVWLLWAQQG